MAKVALVVGASSGFGFHLCLKLLEQGFVVYAAARRTAPMQAIAEQGGHLLSMDICDQASIQSGIHTIVQNHQRIDVLYNNAGLGVYGCIEDIPIEDAKRQFDINLFGAAAITQAVLPFMRKQQSGRIVFTASLASYLTTPASGWYAASKHALKALAEALRMELKGTGIHVIQIEPGPVQTGFEDVAFDHAFEQRMADSPNRPLLHGFKAYMHNSYNKAPGPESTVNAMLKAGTVERPNAIYRTTLDAKLLTPVRLLLGSKLSEWIVMKLFGKFVPNME